jgi:hypothetical protein
MSIPETPEDGFPDRGILWRGWNDNTLRIIQEKNRPIRLVPLGGQCRRIGRHDLWAPLAREDRTLPRDGIRRRCQSVQIVAPPEGAGYAQAA